MNNLYTQGTLGKLTLKNRWIMLAMHTGYANQNGTFRERDFAFYKERSSGGAAAITLVGGVNEIGCQDRMHRLDQDRYNEGIRKVSQIIHEGDCKVFMQLFHAGRNNTAECHQGRLPLAPSEVASPIYRTTPKEMTEAEIQETIGDFAKAAKRCMENGVDCVEVSLSAGYLLSQFLSPLANLRTDYWGGSDEKRMRFPTEVLKAIRGAVGAEYPVIIKISGGDMLGGYDLQYMIDFIHQLPVGTIDGITVTGGWHEAPIPQISYHVTPGGFSELAEKVKQGTGLTVIACNRINSKEAAEEILNRGIVDFVGAARPFLADPKFAAKAEKGIPYNKCQGCNRGCIERVLKYKDVRCAFNPMAGREYLGSLSKRFSSVLVVGAGPVGLETAKLLLKAGSRVAMITNEMQPGGKLGIAATPPHKQDMIAFKDAAVYEIEKMGGTILTGTPITKELIEELNPDHIYFAAGAEPIILPLEGMEDAEIDFITAEDILKGTLPREGSQILVIGGGTVGLETAEFLGAKQKEYEITVLEMAEKAGKDLGGLKWIEMKALKELGVKIKTLSKVSHAVKGGLIVEDLSSDKEEPETVFYPGDTVIFALGSKPRGALSLESYLKKKGIGYDIIGDGKAARNIMEGLAEAYDIVRGIGR